MLQFLTTFNVVPGMLYPPHQGLELRATATAEDEVGSRRTQGRALLAARFGRHDAIVLKLWNKAKDVQLDLLDAAPARRLRQPWLREGKEALRAIVDQWRLGGSRIPEVSARREAFNIMLSMPAGTDPRYVQQAAREFAELELANRRYVMVLHNQWANPHVHISVRAEGRDGKRLNTRRDDLRRWRETFAERLRSWGIEAEATSQITRGTRHRNERVWERKTSSRQQAWPMGAEPQPTGLRRQALHAWMQITHALATSPEVSDRQLAQSIHQYLVRLPAVQAAIREHSHQRELPGLGHSMVEPATRQRRGPEMER